MLWPISTVAERLNSGKMRGEHQRGEESSRVIRSPPSHSTLTPSWTTETCGAQRCYLNGSEFSIAEENIQIMSSQHFLNAKRWKKVCWGRILYEIMLQNSLIPLVVFCSWISNFPAPLLLRLSWSHWRLQWQTRGLPAILSTSVRGPGASRELRLLLL